MVVEVTSKSLGLSGGGFESSAEIVEVVRRRRRWGSVKVWVAGDGDGGGVVVVHDKILVEARMKLEEELCSSSEEDK